MLSHTLAIQSCLPILRDDGKAAVDGQMAEERVGRVRKQLDACDGAVAHRRHELVSRGCMGQMGALVAAAESCVADRGRRRRRHRRWRTRCQQSAGAAHAHRVEVVVIISATPARGVVVERAAVAIGVGCSIVRVNARWVRWPRRCRRRSAAGAAHAHRVEVVVIVSATPARGVVVERAAVAIGVGCSIVRVNARVFIVGVGGVAGARTATWARARRRTCTHTRGARAGTGARRWGRLPIHELAAVRCGEGPRLEAR